MDRRAQFLHLRGRGRQSWGGPSILRSVGRSRVALKPGAAPKDQGARTMRTIEVRRHAPTTRGVERGRGSHLSARGVALARAIGAHSGPFDRVFASLVPRTLETAIAMGFAVDDQWPVLGDVPADALAEIGHH